MIIALVLVLLFGSGLFGSSSLNLSDPAVLSEFSDRVSEIVEDPYRAANVTDAAYRLNVMAWETRSQTGTIEQGIQALRDTLVDYAATDEAVHDTLRGLESHQAVINQANLEERGIIRQNTTKKEWNKLLKNLAK
jgi:hypothetical protein